MPENQLKKVTNGTYTNVDLRELAPGDSIIVKKNFLDAKVSEAQGKFGPYKRFSCGVEYLGDNVTFLLFEKDYQKFYATGAVGDSMRITKAFDVKKQKAYLTFELVQ